jgi:hypothetical protein
VGGRALSAPQSLTRYTPEELQAAASDASGAADCVAFGAVWRELRKPTQVPPAAPTPGDDHDYTADEARFGAEGCVLASGRRVTNTDAASCPLHASRACAASSSDR